MNTPKDGSKILWVHFRTFGDVMQAVADAWHLKKRFPNIKLTFLTEPLYSSLLEEQPWIDQVIIGRRKPLCKYVETVKRVKKEKFDWLITTRHHGGRVALLGFLSGIPNRVGKSKYFQCLFNYPLYEWMKSVEFDVSGRSEPVLFVSEQLRKAAINVMSNLPEKKAFAVIGASTVEKRWLIEHWQILLERLIYEGWGIVLIGSGKLEQDFATKLMTRFDNNRQILNMVDRATLPEVSAIAAECTIAVGNDTGPLHLVALLGTPTVGLADFNLFTGIGLRMPWFRALTIKGEPTHRFNSSKGRSADMLNTITPAQVYEAMHSLLEQTAIDKSVKVECYEKETINKCDNSSL